MATGKRRVQDPFEVALAQEGITGVAADLARSIYMQESSGGRNTKTSNAGAVGGMQIIPSTFASVADKGWNIKDPVHNARAGIRYVNHLFGKADGDPALTAVGYYGGPGAMNKARNGEPVRDPRNPNAPDTFEYSSQVLDRLPNNQGYARLGAPKPSPEMRAPSPPMEPPAGLDANGRRAAPPPYQGEMPETIPAYHGIPDQWSQFGRATKPEVTPEALSFGKGTIGEVPTALVKPVDTGIFAEVINSASRPLAASFKSWGKR